VEGENLSLCASLNVKKYLQGEQSLHVVKGQAKPAIIGMGLGRHCEKKAKKGGI